MAAETSAEELARLAAETQVCQRCDLYQFSQHSVAGTGSSSAEVMLIGEAPSYYDERRGRPFSGPSGQFLDELLALAGLDRTQVFLTNVVKHRTPEARQPLPEEITACAYWLDRQIAAINPRVIVTLGRFATQRYFPGASISRIHGQAKVKGGRVVVAMYNPAAAIHQEALRQTVLDDFRRALPAALSEARRLASEGRLGGEPAPADEPPPQQMSLF